MNRLDDFFSADLSQEDPDVYSAIEKELVRQQDGIELIASENLVSSSVLQAQSSVFTNKYAEGYPGRRYYGGCEFADIVENLARERAKKLFDCSYVNVQAHSGSQANQSVYTALLKPGDTIMGLSLASGGHLTHGAPPSQSGKWFKSIQYGVRREDALIDFDEVANLAHEHKPKLIIAGGSAYPRQMDHERFRHIADEVGAILLADIAHYAGLVVAGLHPNPFPHAHVVTTTTHKTLRGPRGGMIMTNDPEIAKKINSSIFPGIQGGPLVHIIAAKAVAFAEALRPEFNDYCEAVIKNARALGDALRQGGLDLVSGGTDTHIVLVDLRPKGITGLAAEKSLESAGITCNKNGIPFDPEKPTVTSGIRLGTPAATTRGFGISEFEEVGKMILKVLDGLTANPENNQEVENNIKSNVLKLCNRFPIYPNLNWSKSEKFI